MKDWTAEERQKLRDDVPKLGFKAADPRPHACSTLRSETLALARAGAGRAASGSTATAATRRAICAPLQEIVARGITPAEELLEKFHGPWDGSVEPVFEEYAY